MLNFKKIAQSLGLKDVEQQIPGEKNCKDCNSALRLGEKKEEKVADMVFAYCPKCKKIVRLVFMSRVQPGIKIEPHDD